MKVKYESATGTMTSGSNVSFWLESMGEVPVFEELKENLETDVVIVGGGLAGLSVAYNLTEAGMSVIVVEDGMIGSGETGRTSAHLSSALDDRFYNLLHHFGKEKTRIITESHKAAIDFIERVSQKEGIDCDFSRVDGYLFLDPTDKEKNLEKEFEAAREAGLDVTLLPAVPNLMIDEGKCIRFAGQAQFHPMKYLVGLAEAVVRNGGRIFVNTHATEIDKTGIVSDNGFSIRAQHIVVATNPPVTELVTIPMRQVPYRTYIIGVLVEKDVLPKALWWDTGNFDVSSSNPPYHYVRLQNYDSENDILISGGEDHVVADRSTEDVPEENRYSILERWTKLHFPVKEVIYQWSGQVMEPADNVAFIGRSPFGEDNVYIVTGDSGHGMTHCTIAGILIKDLILGNENEWEKIFNPARFSIRETGMFFQLLKDDMVSVIKRWSHKENTEINSIKPGEAAIVKLEGERCGVYRDETGQLHIVSTSCTHMKCRVNWNNDEKTWDCPCHGSRFTYEGKVITGPANDNLDSFSKK